ncbi:MAG: hypothetical protein QXU09_02270 [Thermoproteota archaeon]
MKSLTFKCYSKIRKHGLNIKTVIIVAVGITTAVAVTLWMTGLVGAFMGYIEKIDVDVDIKIYSTTHNIGVLNEEAVFNIVIRNLYNSIKMVNIVIEAEGLVLFNETVAMKPLSSKNLTINQKLIYTGLWTIRFFEDKKMIHGHSFITVVNRSEADVRINQWNDILINRVISIIALVISALSLVISILNFRKGKKEAHTDQEGGKVGAELFYKCLKS